MTFLELAEQILRKYKTPLSVSEIWDKAVELGLDKQLNSNDGNPYNTLNGMLSKQSLYNQKSIFARTKEKPFKYYLKEFANQIDSVIIEPINHKQTIKFVEYAERDLHPLLVKFADVSPHFRGAKLKTIYHEGSIKKQKGSNEWLHPDIVGVYFSFADTLSNYEQVITNFQSEFAIASYKLFSFEMKVKLSISNLRESYFQAVSNSSWANEGYLVTLELDEEIIYEARRLSNAFGIGIIQLKSNNPKYGEIIIPAKTKNELDIDTMNKLASINPYFKKFLASINEAKRFNKVTDSDKHYDKVLNDNELLCEYLIS